MVKAGKPAHVISYFFNPTVMGRTTIGQLCAQVGEHLWLFCYQQSAEKGEKAELLPQEQLT